MLQINHVQRKKKFHRHWIFFGVSLSYINRVINKKSKVNPLGLYYTSRGVNSHITGREICSSSSASVENKKGKEEVKKDKNV